MEQQLSQGLSLAEIGRLAGRHEATVAYWLKKYGLTAANRTKHSSRGGLGRQQLEGLVGAGMSIAEIAEETSLSKATVRHWLMRYGLKTQGALGRRRRVEVVQAQEMGLNVTVLKCRRHGETAFVLDQRGYYRCKLCRSESVSRRRRKVKELLVAEAGGACCVCATRATHVHYISTISTRRESAWKSMRGEPRWRLSDCALRRASASWSVRTAMRRWRQG